MPILIIKTNNVIDKSDITKVTQSASKLVASELKKPEEYVMVSFEQSQQMLFAGSNEPLAYVELKSIGLRESQTAALSASLCQLINDHINVPKDRIYIEFTNAPRKMWGWNGGTF